MLTTDINIRYLTSTHSTKSIRTSSGRLVICIQAGGNVNRNVDRGNSVLNTTAMSGHDKAGADAGLLIGDAPILQGVPIYDFAKFSKKLHEIENILGRRSNPLDPPMKWCKYISECSS